jgi:hypothetical protein
MFSLSQYFPPLHLSIFPVAAMLPRMPIHLRVAVVKFALCLFAAISLSVSSLHAADWPMWRRDPGRGAATDENLPQKLYPQWTRELPAPTPAWPEDPRL